MSSQGALRCLPASLWPLALDTASRSTTPYGTHLLGGRCLRAGSCRARRGPAFSSVYGAENAQRLAIQFVYNTCKLLDSGANVAQAFEATWSAFSEETAEPDWHFAGLANLNNFNYHGEHADLGHGVSILGRSFERLQAMLRLDELIAAGQSQFQHTLYAERGHEMIVYNFSRMSLSRPFRDGADWIKRTVGGLPNKALEPSARRVIERCGSAPALGSRMSRPPFAVERRWT